MKLCKIGNEKFVDAYPVISILKSEVLREEQTHPGSGCLGKKHRFQDDSRAQLLAER